MCRRVARYVPRSPLSHRGASLSPVHLVFVPFRRRAPVSRVNALLIDGRLGNRCVGRANSAGRRFKAPARGFPRPFPRIVAQQRATRGVSRDSSDNRQMPQLPLRAFLSCVLRERGYGATKHATSASTARNVSRQQLDIVTLTYIRIYIYIKDN